MAEDEFERSDEVDDTEGRKEQPSREADDTEGHGRGFRGQERGQRMGRGDADVRRSDEEDDVEGHRRRWF